MRLRKTGAAVSAAVAAVSALALTAPGALAAAPASQVQLRNTQSPAASRTPQTGAAPAGNTINFSVDLALADPSGAAAFAQSVSTPGSPSYHQYLTAAQWEARFSPSQSSVDQVKAFLKQNGFTVGKVPADRMEVPASGTTAQIEKAFSTTLGVHTVQGQSVVLADQPLSVPSSIAGAVSGITGVNEVLAKTAARTTAKRVRVTATRHDTRGVSAAPSGTATPDTAPIPQPPGFRAAKPCGAYYNDKLDTQLPPFGNGYPAKPPWAVCGYVPPQFRSAYGLSGPRDGRGVTVAIVDAYASPTLFSDAHTYANRNDPTYPLRSGQFSELLPASYNKVKACDASGWFGEQTLDVEAVHSTAPGAKILYAGAKNCTTKALNNALRSIVDGHLADVISNSYGDSAGDVLDSAADRNSTDKILEMAAGTGISVLFSSGDSGDEYTTVGQVAADYPASSPYATAVGGTTLQVGANGQRLGEFGWSTARSFLCNSTYQAAGGCTASQNNQWLPIDLALDGGSGGGTSQVYPQPSWQQGVVPASLSQVNGATPMRVEPDVSMEGDPGTGMLVGETQVFPERDVLRRVPHRRHERGFAAAGRGDRPGRLAGQEFTRVRQPRAVLAGRQFQRPVRRAERRQAGSVPRGLRQLARCQPGSAVHDPDHRLRGGRAVLHLDRCLLDAQRRSARHGRLRQHDRPRCAGGRLRRRAGRGGQRPLVPRRSGARR